MNYLRLGLTLLAVYPSSATLFGQNKPPQLNRIVAVADTVARQVTITYSLLDREEGQVKVTLKASDNQGKTYALNTSNATGDVGATVQVGPQKTISWSYGSKRLKLADLRLKLVADDLHPVDINALAAQVDRKRITKTLKTIYGKRNHQTPEGLKHLAVVNEFIGNEMAKSGLEVVKQPYTFAKFKATNLYVRHMGHEDDAKTFVVCSFYNTSRLESFGADASASGMAGVLEVLRVLAKHNFAHSITFLALDDIDEVEARGSTEFVHKGGIKEYEQVQGAICLEGIGHYSTEPNTQDMPDGLAEALPQLFKTVKDNRFRGDFAFLIGNEASDPFTSQLIRSAAKHVPELKLMPITAPGNAETTPALAEGDHVAFWYGNIPAVEVLDGGLTRKIDIFHDKIEDIDYTFVTNVVKGVVAALADLGGLQHSTVATAGVTVR